jgi:hypothetical protein
VTKRKGDPYPRQRPHLVGVRLTDEEHALVLAAARDRGKTAPAVLREAFLSSLVHYEVVTGAVAWPDRGAAENGP